MRTTFAGDDDRFEAAWHHSLDAVLAYATTELPKRLSSWHRSDGRHRDAAEAGVQAALEQLWRDHTAPRYRGFGFYVVAARFRTIDQVRRAASTREVPLEAHLEVGSPEVGHLGHVVLPGELADEPSAYLRLVLAHLGLGRDNEDDEKDVRERLGRLAALMAHQRGRRPLQVGDNTTRIELVLEAHDLGRFLLHTVTGRCAKRGSWLSRPLVAAQLVAALADEHLEEAELHRALGEVIGGDKNTGQHAKRVQSVLGDLLS